jgi:hypothetical protein
LPGRELHPLEAPGFAWRTKVATDICIHDPTNTLRHAPLSQFLQCIMGAASWPKAIRAVVEVLLIDRFQQHRHRSLDNLILERWLPNWTLTPVVLLKIQTRSTGAA